MSPTMSFPPSKIASKLKTTEESAAQHASNPFRESMLRLLNTVRSQLKIRMTLKSMRLPRLIRRKLPTFLSSDRLMKESISSKQ